MNAALDQFESRKGATYKAPMSGDMGRAMYVTINTMPDDTLEVFVRKDEPKFHELATVVARLASMALREGVAPQVVADELMDIHSPETGHMIPGTSETCPSLTARIGKTLKNHIKAAA